MNAKDKRDDANYESVAYWRSETAETRVQLESANKEIDKLEITLALGSKLVAKLKKELILYKQEQEELLNRIEKLNE